jgi:hypothetical protein
MSEQTIRRDKTIILPDLYHTFYPLYVYRDRPYVGVSVVNDYKLIVNNIEDWLVSSVVVV